MVITIFVFKYFPITILKYVLFKEISLLLWLTSPHLVKYNYGRNSEHTIILYMHHIKIGVGNMNHNSNHPYNSQ